MNLFTCEMIHKQVLLQVHSITFPVFFCSPCLNRVAAIKFIISHCLQSIRQKGSANYHIVFYSRFTQQLNFILRKFAHQEEEEEEALSSSTQNAFIYFILSNCFIFSVDIIGPFISDLSGMFDKDGSFWHHYFHCGGKVRRRRRRSNFQVLVPYLSICILLYLLYFRPPLHCMCLILLLV